jgi:type IV pilus assembly protein PilB
VTGQIRDLIDKRASMDHIRNVANKQGTTTLRDNSVELVRKGITTVDELLKVTYSIE